MYILLLFDMSGHITSVTLKGIVCIHPVRRVHQIDNRVRHTEQPVDRKYPVRHVLPGVLPIEPLSSHIILTNNVLTIPIIYSMCIEILNSYHFRKKLVFGKRCLFMCLMILTLWANRPYYFIFQ